MTPNAAPPTTAWGALLKTAALIEAAEFRHDPRGRKITHPTHGGPWPTLALQLVLWPQEKPSLDNEIPTDAASGVPYWAAMTRLRQAAGGRSIDDVALRVSVAQLVALIRAAAALPTPAKEAAAA